MSRKSCAVPGCERKFVAKGYCDSHYARLCQSGDVHEHIPIRERNPKREFYLSKEGYRYIKRPSHPNANTNGWVLEHRAIVADDLGRPLAASETVHHKNGVRTDNRLENLELRMDQHGPEQTIEDRVLGAIEVLSEYAPAMLAHSVDGRSDSEKRGVLEIEMNRLRGRLLGLIESWGLDPSQEQGCKQILKQLSYDAQSTLDDLLAT